MMTRNLFLIIVICIGLLGCADGVDRSKKNLLPELANCDSAAVMYYREPGNPRFFKVVKVYDKKMLATIATDINGTTIAPKDTCTSQGKIYYYGKGDAVYVAYFSRVKDCMTLSFIKTADKYFTKMGKGSKQILDELEKAAKEPVAAN